MLPALLRSLRSPSRRVLRQPPSQWISHHTRAEAETPRLSLALCRLSRVRAIHTTRLRCATEKPPGPGRDKWDGIRDWGFISSEQLHEFREMDDFYLYVFLAVSLAYFGYYEIPHHLPVRTNPNHLMKESMEIIKTSKEVVSHLGAPLIGKGERVFHWHRVESAKIKGQDGKPPRLRIKYNLTGPNGSARVFAEVTEGTAKDEYNYIVVHLDDTKEVLTVIDHRDITHATYGKTEVHTPSVSDLEAHD